MKQLLFDDPKYSNSDNAHSDAPYSDSHNAISNNVNNNEVNNARLITRTWSFAWPPPMTTTITYVSSASSSDDDSDYVSASASASTSSSSSFPCYNPRDIEQLMMKMKNVGMLFVKPKKVGGSSAAGIQLQISKRQAAKIKNNVTTAAASSNIGHNILFCQNSCGHRNGIDFRYRRKGERSLVGAVPVPVPSAAAAAAVGQQQLQQQQSSSSFLWTILRDPEKRAISEYFFKEISRRGSEYSDRKFKNFLEGQEELHRAQPPAVREERRNGQWAIRAAAAAAAARDNTKNSSSNNNNNHERREEESSSGYYRDNDRHFNNVSEGRRRLLRVPREGGGRGAIQSPGHSIHYYLLVHTTNITSHQKLDSSIRSMSKSKSISSSSIPSVLTFDE